MVPMNGHLALFHPKAGDHAVDGETNVVLFQVVHRALEGGLGVLDLRF